MKQRTEKKAILVGLIVTLFLFVTGFAPAEANKDISYAQTENWAYLPEKPDKAVDVFFVAPTVYGGNEQQVNMPIDDAKARKSFLGATNMEKGIYDTDCNFYAPYYRQTSLFSYDKMEPQQQEGYLSYAYGDVKAAFEYYLANENGGRPIVLAGFSQGADMVIRLLKDEFSDPTLQGQLVAAYVIGSDITQEELAQYPQLKMAQGENDIGVIVSFCSESPETSSSIIVPDKTIGINPLNWKTDATPAEASLNKGACFTNYEGEIKEEIPALCGAYLDTERGTLKVTGVTPQQYPGGLSFLEDGNYHLYDYQFFYRNLQKNVSVRVKQYLDLRRVVLGGYARAEISTSLNTNDTYIRTAPNVGTEMLDVNYWLYKTSRADEVLMDSSAIHAWNEKTANDQKDGNGFYRFAAPDGDRTVSGEMLTKILTEFKIPEKTKYINAIPVTQEYWELLSALVNTAAVKEQNPVRYGICLKRGDIRVFPTDAAITGSQAYTFDDDMQNSSILVNEPVVVLHTSADGNWYYIQTNYCGGWVHVSDIALCSSYAEWEKACNPEQFLIVTENKFCLDEDPFNLVTSGLELTMGTKLALVPQKDFRKTVEGREAFDNYIVKIPARDEKGMLYYENAFLPVSAGVHVGYLDYTQGNVLRLAFDCLGERYGWGGMYDARDCSQYVMELYRCFGFQLPRNSSGQASMNSTTINVSDLTNAEKEALLRMLPVGAVLYFPGHVMMYLGETQGNYYVISSVGSFVPEDSVTGDIARTHSVMITDLNTKRASGKTWLECIQKYKVLL